MPTPTLITDDASPNTELGHVLTIIIGSLAAAGGLIHLVAIRDHLGLVVISACFAVVGMAQCAFAFRAFTRPSPRLLVLGGALHAVIAVIWVLSRTTGLWVVPGAEHTESLGVSDLVAHTFSLGVLGAVAIACALDRTGATVVLPLRVARRMMVVTVAGVLSLTVPAVLAPDGHDHAFHTSDQPLAPADHRHTHDAMRRDHPRPRGTVSES